MYIWDFFCTFALEIENDSNLYNPMFKLLAIRVLDGCAKHVKKCLHDNVYYYFSTDYRFEVKDRVYRGSKYSDPLSDSYFTPAPTQHFGELKIYKPTINVNAIVGKNGDGKSSIVELIIRLVNNYIARHLKNESMTGVQKLLLVKGVYAELYFQIDNIIYRLFAAQKSEGIQIVADITPLLEKGETQFVLRQIKPAPYEVMETIYTLISNYSHYAYNMFDFRNEWVAEGDDIFNEETQNKVFWMHRIFHKNDGYITPLSIHPYRTSGNIDINRETLLSRQRLLYLFVKSTDEPNAFRNILGKKAVGIRLTPTKTSKLYERSIKTFFLTHRGKDTSFDWVIDPLRKEVHGITKILRRKRLDREQLFNIQYSINHLLETYIKDAESSLDRILFGAEWNTETREMYNTFLSRMLNEMSTTKNLNVKATRSSIQQYLTIFKSLTNGLNEQFDKTEDKAVINMIFENLPSAQRLELLGNYKSYNLQQIARLYTIFTLALRYQVDPRILYAPFNQISNKEKAQLYKIYKTLSIFETYPKYKDIIAHEEKKWGEESTYEFTPKTLNRLFKQLDEDMRNESHITRKLVQTENYLHQEKDIYDEPDLEIDYPIQDPTSKIKHISCVANYYGASIVDIFHLVPPIFDYDIVLQNGESYMEFETLSSGEKQLLNNIGAVLYHLQNIDTSVVEYNTVNLILEEIELYFHPEFQRVLVNRIIEQIYGIKWKHIQNINITFVTHSPFVLSDIPKNNVLFLKNGKPYYEMQENTFGANIHSLLKNGFFLPNLPIGEFANQKINELFRKLNSGEYDKTQESIEKIRQEISLIGESYLREQLYRLLREKQ